VHDLALARSLPRLVGMRAGRVVFDGPATALDDRAAHAIYGRAA